MEDKLIENNNKHEFKLPKESIRPLGQQCQLSSNRLSSYLGLPTGGAADAVTVDEALKAVLDTVLYPGNITIVTVMQRQQGVKNLTLCIGESGGVTVGMDDTKLRLKPVEIEEFAGFLTGFFDNGTLLESLGTGLSLSRNGLYTLLAAADLYEVNRLMALIEKKTEVDPLTVKGIKGLAAEAISEPDPRQLTTSVLATDNLTELFDIDMGISELSETGIFEQSSEGVLKLTKPGQQLIPGLSEPEILAGIRSYYYDDGMLTEMGLVIWRTRNYLWGIELTDQPTLFSMNFEKVFSYLQSLLSRGDYSDGIFDESSLMSEAAAPGEDEMIKAPVSICSNCGKVLAVKEKFCTNCGTPVPQQTPATQVPGVDQMVTESPMIHCLKCGATLEPGVKFCTKCGNSIQNNQSPNTCPSCQANVEQNAKFCKKCGQPL
ncbi:zinc ribbon domain-containing protein [Acetobacterium sp.]|uniref:zinc ribbon domain-containing protein n=1 Tax=Acetobacterium sp. TaxID=1872094 RepID=UPI003594879A